MVFCGELKKVTVPVWGIFCTFDESHQKTVFSLKESTLFALMKILYDTIGFAGVVKPVN